MPGGGSNDAPQQVTNTVQKSDPWSGQQPFLTQGFERAQQDILNQPQSYFPGSTVVPFSPETETALGLQTQRALQGSPLIGAAQGQLTDTLSGQYLNQGNPAFQGMVDRAIQPLQRQYENVIAPGIDSAFAGAGRYGSNAFATMRNQAADDYMRNIQETAVGLAFPTYEAERTNMMRGMFGAPALANQDYFDIGQLAAVGGAREGLSAQELAEQIERHNFAQQEPRNRLAQYMNLIQGNYGGTATGQTTSNPYAAGGSPLLSGLGGAATGAMLGSMFAPGIGTAIGAGAGGLLGLFS